MSQMLIQSLTIIFLGFFQSVSAFSMIVKCNDVFRRLDDSRKGHIYDQRSGLEELAIPYENVADFRKQFGVEPPLHMDPKTSGRVLFTENLNSKLIRETNPLDFSNTNISELDHRLKNLYSQITSNKGVNFINPEVTDILLYSKQSRGSKNGIVKIGYLEDGLAVAIKTPYSHNPVNEILSSFLLSEIGVGPKFRGFFYFRGRLSYAMDILTGDFTVPEKMTAQSLYQREKILRRLLEFGIESHFDYQDYLSSDGKIRVIDVDGFFELYSQKVSFRDEPIIKINLFDVLLKEPSISAVEEYLLALKDRDLKFFNKIRDYYRSIAYVNVAIKERRARLDSLFDR